MKYQPITDGIVSKSRVALRPILSDTIPTTNPAKNAPIVATLYKEYITSIVGDHYLLCVIIIFTLEDTSVIH